MKLEEKVLIELPKKDCAYLKADVEGHIQDTEEALTEIHDSFLICLYQINLRYWNVFCSLLKSHWRSNHEQR